MMCLTCMEETSQRDLCSMTCYLKAPPSIKELIYDREERTK